MASRRLGYASLYGEHFGFTWKRFWYVVVLLTGKETGYLQHL
jgi:hypothetical protein